MTGVNHSSKSEAGVDLQGVVLINAVEYSQLNEVKP
jgi:hypothetical protein